MTGDTAEGPRILGSLRAEDGSGVVRIDERYDTDIEDLWSAITDPARLASWHADVQGDLHPGGQFRLYLAADDWTGTGRIEACEPPYRLLVTTRETDESWQQGQGVPPFDDVVEVTLTTDVDQTHLGLEVRGLPLETTAYYGAGWQIHAENLAAYVAGREPVDGATRAKEIVPSYVAMAAALG